jgi:hypothetical protein
LLVDETAAVECTHCGILMTSHMGSSRQVRYFRCGSCHRWVSTMYQDVLGADAKVRALRPDAAGRSGDFEQVKGRLERWLASLDEKDPYRTLGVSPLDSTEAIRARYHALAMERHPDRGGSADGMSELNQAYERIADHRASRTPRALVASSAGKSVLPASHR